MADLSDINHPIDEDYLDVDNWEPPSEMSQEQRIDISEMDSDISAEAADGALSKAKAMQDVENIITNDGRSTTRTTFWPEEVTTKYSDTYSRLNRLARLNDGERSPDRPKQNSVADKNRIIDTFCGYCEVPHRERINYLYDNFDMSRKGPRSFEEVILAIISLVCQSKGRAVRNEDRFLDLMNDVGMTHSDLRSCKRLCREHFERAEVEV